ncbi:invasion associated locus B family protein [uncultured Salinisphaera sp.]|uniref:invasion associated locus B family protein n=1 Tax=uncultured Salinisphaera sp. TaxID=359372 RepID=UPI0032B12033
MTKVVRFSVFVLAAVMGMATAAPVMAQAGGEPADDVKITRYNDWEVRCPKSGPAQNDCEMTQLINGPDGNKPIMRVVMGYPPQIDSAAMIFILPLGTRLAPGVQLSVDGDQPRRFPFQICLEQGCRADFPIEDSLLAKMKRGSSANVTIVGPKGDQIDLAISLSGFTDANNAIAN